MLTRTNIGLTIEQDELKGFSRTIAEIEWLLLALVLVYLLAGAPPDEGGIALNMALFFFAAFILGLHYVQFYKEESRSKLLFETVVMIDSDNLKQINDAHGHEAGNRLLQHLVRCVREQLRGSDVMARFGGDEFILLLPETNNKGALEMAERIRKAVELARFSVRDGESNVTVSLGVSSYPEDGGNLDVILEKADKAMYRAKQKGRNRVVSYME